MPVIISDIDGNVEYVNLKYSEMTGYSEEEAVGKNFHLLKSVLFPAEKQKDFFDAVFSGLEWRCEFINRKKNGEPFWDHTVISPVRNGEGVITHVIGFKENVTERKIVEDQLHHAHKMSAVGQLAAGISHDFNNIITVVYNCAKLLQMEIGKEHALGTTVNQILAATKKATVLSGQLLSLCRKQAADMRPVNLNSAINESRALLSHVVTDDIDLKIILAHEDLIIMADPLQIEQVLINLAANARDAMPHGGVLCIETSRSELNEEHPGVMHCKEPGAFAVVSITDTGIGIDEKIRKQIFDPFFTTKDVGKGTGLGLSTACGIIRSHNGFISVDSAPDKGTTFRICLPIVEARVERTSETEQSPHETAGKETILLADDDVEIRKTMKHILEDAGYKVIVAVNGEDAINKFLEELDEISLVILDAVMSKRNGKDVYDEIKRVSPHTRAVFMSGYCEEIIKTRGFGEKGLKFVPKPISPDELLKNVRQALDMDSGS